MPLGKLIRTERSICIYKRTDDSNMGEEVAEINIDFISLDNLKTIVTPNEDDPLLYDGYLLSEKELAELNNFLDKKIEPDFNQFEYLLECWGIYEK